MILLGGTECSEWLWSLPSMEQTSQYGAASLTVASQCSSALRRHLPHSRQSWKQQIEPLWAQYSSIGNSFHWKPNKHLMCYFHSHSSRIGQSVLCLLYLKLVVCLHLHEEQLHQPFVNKMRCFLWVCGSSATQCGSAFNEVSSFLEHSVWAVVQCGQQAASEVQSVMLETSKIIKKRKIVPIVTFVKEMGAVYEAGPGLAFSCAG